MQKRTPSSKLGKTNSKVQEPGHGVPTCFQKFTKDIDGGSRLRGSRRATYPTESGFGATCTMGRSTSG